MGALIYARRLGPHFSEGARLLWLSMEHRDYTQEDLRQLIGKSKGVIGRWLRGDQRPDGESRGLLFELLKIKPQAWDSVPQKAFSIERGEA